MDDTFCAGDTNYLGLPNNPEFYLRVSHNCGGVKESEFHLPGVAKTTLPRDYMPGVVELGEIYLDKSLLDKIFG